MNVCGYDSELSISLPVRNEVRAELTANANLPDVQIATKDMCRFYHDHQQIDGAHDLAQYVSLALNLGPPPDFTPRAKEADMPPDVGYVLGFVPLLKQYYSAAKVHEIWVKHYPQYAALIEKYHDPVSNMISANDTYVRMPISSASGRGFVVYLEPMSAPGQVNSRNYYEDLYFVVISPTGDDIHMEAIRHTYLHFLLDPLIDKRATSLKRLQPLLLSVKSAPLPADDKQDIGLLILECVIRAIEAKDPLDSKMAEKDRLALVNRDEKEGYVLTGYFYDQLKQFEKDNLGLQDAFPNWLHDLNLDQAQKIAKGTTFAAEADPEVMRATKPASQQKVDLAERQLSVGNYTEAGKLAQEALDAKEDQGRAYFILARADTLNGDMDGARSNFLKALESSKDPQVEAWSHIYLGRILDLQDEREAAVDQYKAALSVTGTSPETRNAAERGVKQPYQPPEGKGHQPKE